MAATDIATVVVFFVLSYQLAAIIASTEERALINFLFNRSEPAARPVLRPTDPVNITLSLRINNVVRLDEIEEKIILKMTYEMLWNTPTLTWDPAAHGNVTTLHLPPDRVWTPDLVVQTSTRKERKRSPTVGLLANTFIVFHAEGVAVWNTPTMTEAACHVDPSFFPFDRHVCLMNFTLWTHPARLANLSPGDPAVTLIDDDQGIWTATALPMTKEEILYVMHNEPSHQLVAGLYLERTPFFYVYNIIYPGAILLVCSLIGFYIPHTMGKMTYGISIMLTIMMFQQYLMKVTVRTSITIPILGQFFGTGMAVAFLSIVSGVMTLRLVYNPQIDSKSHPNATWMRLLGRVTCMQKNVTDILTTDQVMDQPIAESDSTSSLEVDRRSCWRLNHGKNEAKSAVKERNHDPRARCRAVPVRTDIQVPPMESIVSEVTELKKRFLSETTAEEEEDTCKGFWESTADMFQRLALIISLTVLVFACLGISLQLAVRPPLTTAD